MKKLIPFFVFIMMISSASAYLVYDNMEGGDFYNFTRFDYIQADKGNFTGDVYVGGNATFDGYILGKTTWLGLGNVVHGVGATITSTYNIKMDTLVSSGKTISLGSTLFNKLGQNEARQGVHFGVGNLADKSLILTELDNMAKNHDTLIATNPTFYVFSATDPDTDNTQWLSFTHNTTDSLITSGKGDIIFSTSTNNVTVAEIKDAVDGNFTGKNLSADYSNAIHNFSFYGQASDCPSSTAYTAWSGTSSMICTAFLQNDSHARVIVLNVTDNVYVGGNTTVGGDILPDADDAYDIGSVTGVNRRFAEIYATDLHATYWRSPTGSTQIAGFAAGTGVLIFGHLFPSADNTYDLSVGSYGGNPFYWRNIGLKSNLTDGTNNVSVAELKQAVDGNFSGKTFNASLLNITGDAYIGGSITQATKTSYWSCPGTNFNEQYNSVNIRYDPARGNIYVESGSKTLMAPVFLPHEAVVIGFIVYGNIADETATLYRYALGSSGGSDMASANLNTENTSISNATIDNSAYRYWIETSTLDTDDEIYSARITYTI